MLSPTLGTRVPCSICGGRSAEGPAAGCMFKLFGPTSDPPYAFGLKPPFVLQPRKYGTVTIRQWWDVHVHRDPFNSYLYGLDSGARFGGSCGGGGLFEYDKAFPKRIPAETKCTTSIEYMYNTVQTWHRVWYHGMVCVRTLVLHWRWLRLILLVLDVLDSNALIKSNTCAVRRMLDIATCLQTTIHVLICYFLIGGFH